VRNFIDESGAFSWGNKGISLFCGVTVSDRELPLLEQRFLRWKSSIIGKSKRELKGGELTGNQLYSFSHRVLPPDHREIHLTLVGADTSRSEETFVQQVRGQAVEMFRIAGGVSTKEGNQKMAEQYRQMSGWLNNRSSENVLWIIVLEEAVKSVLQHVVARFAEREFDSEFENIEFLIDESFIRRDEHIEFWREWLRNGLMRSARKGGLATPNSWSMDHPFKRKYVLHKGLLDLTDLFRNNTDFHDSRTHIGLQVADICAHISYRFFRNDPDVRAYANIQPRLVCRGGHDLNLVVVDQSSILKDDLANHVGTFDIEAWKRMGEERGVKITDLPGPPADP
jgi:hypothetical protein